MDDKMQEKFRELGVSLDIASRMALIAMAKSMNCHEIRGAMAGVRTTLNSAYGDKSDELVSVYTEAAVSLSEKLDKS